MGVVLWGGFLWRWIDELNQYSVCWQPWKYIQYFCRKYIFYLHSKQIHIQNRTWSVHTWKISSFVDASYNEKMKVLVTQSCPTLCDPTESSLPGSSVHGIFQLRILEWVAIPFSRGSSWPRDRTRVSCIAGRFFTVWATRSGKMFGDMICTGK